MSTNKTTHYQLHSWHPDDEFHVAEINENFTKLDSQLNAEAQARVQGLGGKADTTQITALEGALRDLDSRKVHVLTGSYVGGNRIELGVKPLAVISMVACGNMSSATTWYGIAAQGMPLTTALVLDESGFTPGVDVAASIRLAFNSFMWHYIVFY